MAIVLKNYPLAYWPSPKVASTSIKSALFALDNGVDTESIEGIHDKMQADRFAEAPKGITFKFAVIREPIERFLAAYCHRVLDLKELSRGHASGLGSLARFKRRNLRPDPDIHWFIRHLENYRFSAFVIEHHTELQIKFVGNDPSYFDQVFLFHKISDVPDAIERAIGRRITLPHKMKSQAKIDRGELDANEIKGLQAFYRDDFRFFNAVMDAQA